MINIKDQAFDHLKELAIQMAFKKLFGSIVVGGVKGYIVSKLIGYGMDKFVKPAYYLLYRKGVIAIKRKEIELTVKELESAANETDFDAAVDNLE